MPMTKSILAALDAGFSVSFTAAKDDGSVTCLLERDDGACAEAHGLSHAEVDAEVVTGLVTEAEDS